MCVYVLTDDCYDDSSDDDDDDDYDNNDDNNYVFALRLAAPRPNDWHLKIQET